MGFKIKEKFLPYLLLSPIFIVIFALGMYPFLYALYMSLFTWTPQFARFEGLNNYLLLFRDPTFYQSLGVTLTLVAICVTCEFFLGLAFALALNRQFKFRPLVYGIVMMPNMITAVAMGLVWKIIYHAEWGPLPYIMDILGIYPYGSQWLTGKLAIPLLAITDIYQWTPFMFLVLLAGMQSIPVSIYEAALIDGASAWRRVINITLPLLKRAMLVALVIRIMDAMKLFDVIFIMTGGGPGNTTEALSLYIYKLGLKYFDMGYAAAVAIIFLLLVSTPIEYIITKTKIFE